MDKTYHRLIVYLYDDTIDQDVERAKAAVLALSEVYEVDVETSPDEATWR